MARRRYQRGSLFVRKGRWVGRWLEDERSADGKIRRVYRSKVLGTKAEIPTRKLALRALARRVASVNDPGYRPRSIVTFEEFAVKWESTVLPQFKPSTQADMRSQLHKYLIPFFGDIQMDAIRPETVQQFVGKPALSPKRIKNLVATFRIMWKQATEWDYVQHDAIRGVKLPRSVRPERFYLTAEEANRIIAAASEPLRTLYWLAAATGMRAGELCGLRIQDIDLGEGAIYVRQSVWRGKAQTPKSKAGNRCFAIGPQLRSHLENFISRWRPNAARLVFATRNGTPMDPNLIVKRKLRPLCESLEIRLPKRTALHAFRHGNATALDAIGAPMKVRQRRLGHADAQTTMDVYTHTLNEDERRVGDELDEIFHPLSPKTASEPIIGKQQTKMIQ